MTRLPSPTIRRHPLIYCITLLVAALCHLSSAVRCLSAAGSAVCRSPPSSESEESHDRFCCHIGRPLTTPSLAVSVKSAITRSAAVAQSSAVRCRLLPACHLLLSRWPLPAVVESSILPSPDGRRRPARTAARKVRATKSPNQSHDRPEKSPRGRRLAAL